jgi:hypothetical protein
MMPEWPLDLLGRADPIEVERIELWDESEIERADPRTRI